MFVSTQKSSDFPAFLGDIEQRPLSPLNISADWTR